MKYAMERLPESRVAIDVEVEPEAVEQAIERVVRRIAQKARIPGFRPGKAPRYIIEMHFGREYLLEEAGEELVKRALQEVIDKGEVEPVGPAELEKFERQPFSFRLVVPVRPTVTLGDYRALRFPEEVREITDEDVEHALRHMVEEQTVWKEPDPRRPARAGDRLVVDLVGRVGEKEIESRKGAEIVVGDPDLLPGFEALAGAEVGRTVEIPTTLPAEMEDKELAGQAALYTVTINGLKEPEVPPLDDDFARNYGDGAQTLDELRANLRAKLTETARQQARERVLMQMLDAIVDGATVDMPQVLLQNEAEALYQEQAEQLRAYQVSMEQFLQWSGQSEEEYRKRLAEAAPGRMRRYLVLRELLRAEGLSEGPQMTAQLEERLLAIARGELEAPAAGAEEPAVAAEPAAPVPAEEAPAAGT